MDERLVAADAALKAGRLDEAIDLMVPVIREEPNQPAHIYRVLLTQLYKRERFAEGAEWGAAGLERYPRDLDLLNLTGVMLRKLKRYPEALAKLDVAAKLAPGNAAILSNRGNVLLDLDDGVRAEPVWTRLVRSDPRNAEFVRQLGRSFYKQGKLAIAKSRFKQALALQKTLIDAWLDIIAVANDEQDQAEAQNLLEKGLAANPESQKLHEARVILMRRAQETRRADAYLSELVGRMPETAWVHFQLGATVGDYARDRANMHLKRATELAPDNLDYLLALIESLERTRSGDEGAHIEAAYQLVERALALKPTNPGQFKVLNEIMIRVCAFDDIPRLGDFKSLGRGWATTNRHTALLKHLAHVKTLEDRYELLEQHAIWGRKAEADAARNPVRHPAPRAPGGKIRLGLLSSDLRAHPVGYFAQPLFDNVDPRFELYVYSFYQGEQADKMQQYFTSKSTAYRWTPEISSPNAAQMIADDQLDILIELGGTTHMNRLDLMAYRAAPRQASWLGYPHSAGLSTIDYLITDPYNTPPKQDLLLEKPLVMPHTWIALGRAVFTDAHEIKPGVPQDRSGVITYGTANNPHKYNPEMFAVWARVLRETPGSRFLFVRPEGGTPSFRRNVLAAFEKGGVAADRIGFSTVRGAHMPFYNEIDISLDTFPLTGGTTTTESLWMGVPVISLIGEAFYERLSYSILANSGLADLANPDIDSFVRTAVALAGDRERRLALRHGLRDMVRSGPLGQTDQFARDFYDLIAKTVLASA